MKKERFLLECVEKLDRLAIKDAFPAKREDYITTYKSLYEINVKYLKRKNSENTLLHEKVNLLTEELEAYIKASYQKSRNMRIKSLLNSKDTNEQIFNDLDESSSP